MRILKSDTYINEKLNIKPVTRERLDDLKDPDVDDYIKDFIRETN